MRPASEDEAIQFLKRCRFVIDGSKIKPDGRPEDISVAQADAIDFLCQEHGYALDDSPQPKEKRRFFDDNQALIFLGHMGYRFRNGVIIPPPNALQAHGVESAAIQYLCDEWDYSYAK